MKVLSSDQAGDMGKRSGETPQGAPASDGRVGVPRSPVPRKVAKQGREAQAMTKLGRPRIIESPAEMDRLVEEYVTKCQTGPHS